MSSIPYFIKKDAENILKNTTKQVINENTNLFSDFFDIKLSSIFLLGKLKKIIVEIYKKAIQKIDNLFFESDYRKKNLYSSYKRERTVIKVFGEISFERYYYVDKNKENGFFLIDELFGFEKYKTYDEVIRSILINHSVIDNANKASINYDLNLLNLEEYISSNAIQKIPRQTIYNWIKEWDIPKVEYDYYGDSKRLYVMVDEKWIHEQLRLSLLSDEEKKKRHYIMGKCFVTFTGAKTKNNRKELLNRHVFMTTEDKPWKLFIDDIYNIYNFETIEEIYLLSDSGSWILAGKDELKLFKNNKVILNTCEFHVKEYINRLTSSKEKREKITHAIYENESKDDFIVLVDEIIENAKNKDKKTQYKNYILNHWKAILNMKDRDIKSSMESHISHYVADNFGSRPKGFSKKRIEKYIKLQEYKANGINIMDLYLQSYNKTKDDNFIYNKENVSFSLFENNTSLLPTKSSSNPLSCLLNNIAWGN